MFCLDQAFNQRYDESGQFSYDHENFTQQPTDRFLSLLSIINLKINVALVGKGGLQ